MYANKDELFDHYNFTVFKAAVPHKSRHIGMLSPNLTGDMAASMTSPSLGFGLKPQQVVPLSFSWRRREAAISSEEVQLLELALSTFLIFLKLGFACSFCREIEVLCDEETRPRVF